MNKSPMNTRKRGNDTPTPEVPQSRATKIAVLRRMCSYLFKHKLLVLMAFMIGVIVGYEGRDKNE